MKIILGQVGAQSMDAYEGKFPQIPERISRLGTLACNLWWSWHPEAKALFHMLSGNGAEFRANNPVRMLHELDNSVLVDASKDSRFLRRYDAVMARFDAEMNA
jgi:starch phosphorylase